jgi:hypothetical protein
MASKIDQLLQAYEGVLSEPWTERLSGKERVWFLVYDPADQRKMDLRIGDFENATRKSGRRWACVSMKLCFPEWMSAHEDREAYFEDPADMLDQLDEDFKEFAIQYLKSQLAEVSQDENTVIAVRDVSSLFGFVRLSDVLNGCHKDFDGRMLVFFPGEFEANHYRLLDARDGWSYLARPITA